MSTSNSSVECSHSFSYPDKKQEPLKTPIFQLHEMHSGNWEDQVYEDGFPVEKSEVFNSLEKYWGELYDGIREKP